MVSDIHLGYSAGNSLAFQTFLEKIIEAREGDLLWCTHLVLAGDTFDLWRRDIPDVLNDTREIQAILKSIDEVDQTSLHFIVGNHDYYFRKEQEYPPPFNFSKGLKMNRIIDNKSFHFLHGDEFDLFQRKEMYDKLCLSGGELGTIWDNLPYFLRGIMEDLGDQTQDFDTVRKVLIKLRDLPDNGLLSETEFKIVKEFFNQLDFEVDEFKQIIKIAIPPESRFPNMFLLDESADISMAIDFHKFFPIRRSKYPGIVRRALNYARDNHCTLIFGHTHKPFIYSNEVTIANSGGWVEFTDKEKRIFMRGKSKNIAYPFHNTFLVIDKRSITLNAFTPDGTVENIQKETF